MTQTRPDHKPLVPPGEIDHHVADMTATFSADVTLADAQRRLSEAGQWLPIDGDAQATLGALVEINSTGPLRLGYGAWRDLLLGAQFLNGKNELITAGGRTVKNVAGYDLTKFIVGQRGIFGKLITLTTRTYKRPPGALLATLARDPRLVNRLIPTDLRPQWCVMTPEAILCGYLGDDAAKDFYQRTLGDLKPLSIQRRSIEDDIAHRGTLWNGAMFRASVPPARLSEFVEQAKLTQWVADAAFGIVLGSCEQFQIDYVRDVTSRFSGTLMLLDDRFNWFIPRSDDERALLERLKTAFDPDGKLKALPWQIDR